MRIRTPVRLILTLLATPLVVVLYLNIETYAQSKGWDTLLKDTMEGQVPNVVEWTLQPWVGLTSLAVTCIILGLWADTLLRRFDASRPSRADRLEALGNKSIALASDIAHILRYNDPAGFPSSIFAEIRSILVEYSSYGLPKLGTNIHLSGTEKLQLAHAFFSHVGPLLRDGHYKEAKRVANNLIEQIRERERPAPQAQQGAHGETPQ